MVETGHNLLMDLNAVTKCIIVHIQTSLLAVNSFYLFVGSVLSPLFRKVTFIIKFCGSLVDQPGSVVV